MRPEDLDAVVELWHETRKATYTFIELKQRLTLEDSRRYFAEQIAPHGGLWVTCEQDGPVGFLALRGSYLDRMYVHPKAQRRGVGTALLAKARELSPSGLELHTHQRNRAARAFYEKHGFAAVRVGTSPPPESEPDVEYHWRPA